MLGGIDWKLHFSFLVYVFWGYIGIYQIGFRDVSIVQDSVGFRYRDWS